MKNSIKLLFVCFALLQMSCGSSSTASDPKSGVQKIADSATNGAASNSATATAPAGFKKYDIKSGIVTIENNMSVSGMEIATKQIIYFDNYGVDECQEDYDIDAATKKEKLNTVTMVKDGFRYSWSPERNSGSKMKSNGYGVSARFDMGEAKQSGTKENNYKELSTEIIAGKSCTGMSMVTPSGNIEMYGWNHITMKTTLDSKENKMKSTAIATKIEENASIPADKFVVPAGVKFIDM